MFNLDKHIGEALGLTKEIVSELKTIRGLLEEIRDNTEPVMLEVAPVELNSTVPFDTEDLLHNVNESYNR